MYLRYPLWIDVHLKVPIRPSRAPVRMKAALTTRLSFGVCRRFPDLLPRGINRLTCRRSHKFGEWRGGTPYGTFVLNIVASEAPQ